MASACASTADFASTGFPEMQGVGSGVTLWALFFPTDPQLMAGKEIKVVWRMTGRGDLHLDAAGPGGAAVQPIWGPEPHGSSNWDRPGDEWGTGWLFPNPGCWTITATRDGSQGYLVVRVAPSLPG